MTDEELAKQLFECNQLMSFKGPPTPGPYWDFLMPDVRNVWISMARTGRTLLGEEVGNLREFIDQQCADSAKQEKRLRDIMERQRITMEQQTEDIRQLRQELLIEKQMKASGPTPEERAVLETANALCAPLDYEQPTGQWELRARASGHGEYIHGASKFVDAVRALRAVRQPHKPEPRYTVLPTKRPEGDRFEVVSDGVSHAIFWEERRAQQFCDHLNKGEA